MRALKSASVCLSSYLLCGVASAAEPVAMTVRADKPGAMRVEIPAKSVLVLSEVQ